MTNYINTKNSPLFQQLSEQQQELASGGCSHNSPFGMFLYQQKDVLSYANSNTNFSDSDSQLSIDETALYSSSETTFLFIPFFGGSGRNRNRLNGFNINWLISFFS